ncbi:GntR family transcriptional regulator [Anoxybacterium hadale]|uniref:GntR family transcriptional regulator n=1 Tax=Anoxybacterium hadale TaxID=3408580 RepID=A0ACD1ABJ4_9FIRM|nr:GntR family transcriptional regulator [Clostridiales bacterium]
MDITSLRHMAMDNILSKIHSGEFSQENIITETMICEALNISRTPAREALIELVANGVLERVPRKGYAITKFDHKTKLGAYEILANMDALAAKLALPNMTTADLDKMREHIDLANVAIKYKNYPAYCEQQENFHSVYINKCDNKQLMALLKQIKATLDRYTYYSKDETELFAICASMNKEHLEIVELFEKGDKKKLFEYLSDNHWSTKAPHLI